MVGGATTGNIESSTDRDWFAVSLQSGTTYRIDLEGSPTNQGTLSDPELFDIRTSSGSLISGTTLELSQTQARAELDLLESRYYGRTAEIDRLNAERLKLPKNKFPQELVTRRKQSNIADILAVQEDLFAVRRLRYYGQTEILGLRISQLEEKLNGLQANQGAKKRMQELIKSDLKRLNKLYKKQLIDEVNRLSLCTKEVLIARSYVMLS